MKSLLRERDRTRLLARFDALSPSSPARWGTLDAPRMLTHLADQMRMVMRGARTEPVPGIGRVPVLGTLLMVYVPWPKGRIRGPAAAFDTSPDEWARDLEELRRLVDDFVGAAERAAWPDHPNFGRMSHRRWGVFSHRHFDHHLRQFGA